MRTNRFRARVPNSVRAWFPDDYFDDRTFNTIEELMEMPHVKFWRNKPEFVEFRKSSNFLMAIMNDGSWWAIGLIRYPKMLDMPTWKDFVKELRNRDKKHP